MVDSLHESIPTSPYETALGTPGCSNDGPLPYFHDTAAEIAREIAESVRPDKLPGFLGVLVDARNKAGLN